MSGSGDKILHKSAGDGPGGSGRARHWGVLIAARVGGGDRCGMGSLGDISHRGFAQADVAAPLRWGAARLSGARPSSATSKPWERSTGARMGWEGSVLGGPADLAEVYFAVGYSDSVASEELELVADYLVGGDSAGSDYSPPGDSAAVFAHDGADLARAALADVGGDVSVRRYAAGRDRLDRDQHGLHVLLPIHGPYVIHPHRQRVDPARARVRKWLWRGVPVLRVERPAGG